MFNEMLKYFTVKMKHMLSREYWILDLDSNHVNKHQILKCLLDYSYIFPIMYLSQNKTSGGAFVIECHGFAIFCLKPLKTI